MAKLVIQTQIRENYGTALRPHWKSKGGEDYVVSNFTQFNDVQSTIDSVREQVETDNDFYQEYIVCWNVVDNDYLTDYERQQLEFDGRITYPAQELVVVDLQEN